MSIHYDRNDRTKLTGTIVSKPLQSTGTIVSNQINFVNLIYDS
ncbi:MAG: hypothetical protein ACOYME_09935 [Prochlorotrichaceae cyanobacterium]